MKTITAPSLKPQLTAGPEIAFLDVREHGQYGEGHPFFCVSIPFSVLEHRVPILVPRRSTPIVLMDDGDGTSTKSATALETLGYSDISLLQDGVHGWSAAGFGLFKGVNLPSKTFGELVEHELDTPSISAEDLSSMFDRGEDVVVLDGRPPHEFNKMSLPGAKSCPNAELAYRISHFVSDDTIPVVINCAGRTRSIIGTESLRQAGIRNPVYALRNGTQGWRLAGLDLRHNEVPGGLATLDGDQLTDTKNSAEDLAERMSLSFVSMETVTAWDADVDRTTYLLDVRTKEEFDSGHWKTARHAPGGQLVQATDEYLAVRGARIVLTDDTNLRAATSAMWLRSMGHDVYILDANAADGREKTAPTENYPDSLTGEQAAERIAQGITVLDTSRGMEFRKGHIRGAVWATRARLDRLALPGSTPLLVTGQDPVCLKLLVADLKANDFEDVQWFTGSPETWTALGLETESSPDLPTQADCIDHLFFVHDRHDGNLDAARRYLEWEQGLLAQLDDQERELFARSTNWENWKSSKDKTGMVA